MSTAPIARILEGSRILVVEDNYLVAGVIVQHMRLRGAVVVGPAASVDRAMELVEREPFDAALLDGDLQGHNVAPVALRVRAMCRPFLFLTGYGSNGVLPPELADEPRVTKPVQMDDLANMVKALIARVPGRAPPC